jgi:outer membrane protein insertion porin family
VEVAGLGGDVQFVRASAEGRFYYPITEKITFVGRAIGGHIEGWGGQDVRLLDMFYKGGETIRGFYTSGFGPRDLLTKNSLGGDTFWATTAEVRFPFPLIPDELGMSGAIFADAGSLFGAAASAKALDTQCTNPQPYTNPSTGVTTWPGVCLADTSAVRASIGFGLLWNSPLGPLRLDIAKPLLKQSYDIDQIVRFGASTKF